MLCVFLRERMKTGLVPRLVEISLGPLTIRRRLPGEAGASTILVSGKVGGLKYLLKGSRFWDPELLRIAGLLIREVGKLSGMWGQRRLVFESGVFSCRCEWLGAVNDGFAERVRVVQAFLGHASITQLNLSDDPSYAGISWMTEEELLEATNLKCVDFLKCDIEGGEFGLLHQESALLRMTRKLAIEVHAFAGNVQTFIHMLKEVGFTVRHIQPDPDGTATVLARRG